MTPKASIRKYFRIDRRELHYMKSILEGYGGLAVMRTVDAAKGLVVLYVGKGCEEEVDMIIHDLQRNMLIESVQMEEGPALSRREEAGRDGRTKHVEA